MKSSSKLAEALRSMRFSLSRLVRRKVASRACPVEQSSRPGCVVPFGLN